MCFHAGTQTYFPPLQATDFVAWEVRRAMEDAEAGRPYRKQWEYLRELFVPRDMPEGTAPFLSLFGYSETDLLGFCLGHPELYRKDEERKPFP